jgi:hypothetical protein
MDADNRFNIEKQIKTSTIISKKNKFYTSVTFYRFNTPTNHTFIPFQLK